MKGECLHCGGKDLAFGDISFSLDEEVLIDVSCESCGSTFRELYAYKESGHLSIGKNCDCSRCLGD